jgi:hypothetical protein
LLTASVVEYLSAAGRQPDAEAALLKFLNHCQDKVVIWGPQGKQNLSLEESVNVFKMIQQIVMTSAEPKEKPERNLGWPSGTLPSFRPRDPKAFVPAIQRIAQNVKEQAKRDRDGDSYYADEADKMLAWCRKHAN